MRTKNTGIRHDVDTHGGNATASRGISQVPDGGDGKHPHESSTTIAVHSLGTFQLTINGRPVERWRAGKARNLLQFLLLRRGRIVSRDSLFESLWPEASWSVNSSSLKVAVHMLRQILAGQDNGSSISGGSALRLVTRESGYLLEAHNVFIDFELFDELIDRARDAQQKGERQRTVRLYGRAIELYRGDYLPGVTMDWAEVQREWLRSRLLCALEYLTEADLAAGDHLAVIGWCRRMLEIEPFHEETFRALILVHAQLGQFTQVHRWYRLCAARLRDGLQVAPDETTQRLYARAVRGDFVGRQLDTVPWHRSNSPGRPAPGLRSVMR